MLSTVRRFYLDALRSDDLNTRFGGPLFVFLLFSTSLFLFGSWINDDGGAFTFAETFRLAEREDFAAFYRAGQMAGLGQAADAYDYFKFSEEFSKGNKFLFFLNPPHALLFFEPLSYLSYPAAKSVFMTLSLVCLMLSVYLIRLRLGFWPYLFVLLSAGTFYSFQLLQLAPITTFLLLFALLHSRRHPVLSGFALAVLTIKPQYGLLVPVFLIARRDWYAFAVAAFGSLILMLLSLVIYGLPVWQAFLGSLTSGVHSVQFQVLHNIMITAGNALGKFGAGTDTRMAMQLLTMVAMAGVVWLFARKWQREKAVAFSLMAMCVAAPSFIFYDWLSYAMALLLLLKVKHSWPLSLQAGAGFLWIAPVVHDIIYQYNESVAFYFSGSIWFLAVGVLTLSCFCLRGEEPADDVPVFGDKAYS